jgi:hypothetical protein
MLGVLVAERVVSNLRGAVAAMHGKDEGSDRARLAAPFVHFDAPFRA